MHPPRDTSTILPFEKIAKSLGTFRHARRRFEIKYQSDRFLLVDDYAHHPTEIRATLATAKSAGRKRVLTMFQPHRYSRTKALQREFGAAFDDADHVFVTDVYAASEAPLPGVTGQTIADAISAHGHRGVERIGLENHGDIAVLRMNSVEWAAIQFD